MQSQQVPETIVPDEIVKMGSLLKVFSTVIKSLGEDFDPLTSHELSMGFFLEVKQLISNELEMVLH